MIDEQQSQLEEIVTSIVDPLVDSLVNLSSQFPTTDQDVFMLNSLYQVHLTLALFQFNDARLQVRRKRLIDPDSISHNNNIFYNFSNFNLTSLCTWTRCPRSRRAT